MKILTEDSSKDFKKIWALRARIVPFLYSNSLPYDFLTQYDPRFLLKRKTALIFQNIFLNRFSPVAKSSKKIYKESSLEFFFKDLDKNGYFKELM